MHASGGAWRADLVAAHKCLNLAAMETRRRLDATIEDINGAIADTCILQ
jgi:hypothetical protein